ncbi:MAG TPA: hypothetical protein VLD13_04760 [Gaiellaceae bacterium]|nr:hypothetical protein [Gaiellaceae bacterium]
MRARRALAVAGAAVASAVGAVLLRRRAARGRDRAELYFEDGSLVTLTQGSPEADRILAQARELLAAARS